MELKWLEDYLSLCRTGNFSRASRERHVTQPAFSRRIKALEDWLGAELIDRTTYPARPTEAGEAFLPVARQIARLAQQAREDMARRQRIDEDTLCFATLHTLSLNFLPKWLKALQPMTGPVGSRVWADIKNLDGYLEHLEQGICDFLILYHDPASAMPIDAGQFPSCVVGMEKLLPVAAPGRTAESFPGSESRPLPYLRYAPYSHLGKIVAHRLQHDFAPVRLEDRHETSLAESLKAMALEGYGVAWLPRSIAEDSLASGALVRLGAGAFDIEIEIRLFRHAQSREKRVERLWRIVEDMRLNR